MSMMDNAAISRIAMPDIAGDALSLLKEYGDIDDVVFFLGRMAWQGAMAELTPDLLQIAIDPARGLYARIAAIRTVMSIGSDEQKDALWNALGSHAGPLDRRLLAETLNDAAPSDRSIELLLNTLERLAPHNQFETTGLGHALHGFIDRLPVMADKSPDQPLARLVEGLNLFLDREPFIEQAHCRVSDEFKWLIPVTVHAADRLVAARAPQALSSAIIAILTKWPTVRRWRGDDMHEYQSALATNVPRWRELNDTLYWSSIHELRKRVAQKGQRIVDDWQATFFGHIWAFGSEDFDRCLDWVSEKQIFDDRLVALSRSLTLYVEADRPSAWLDRLKVAVRGEPELEAALEQRLNPAPPPAIVSMEAEHRRWERRREKEERKTQRDRTDWVRLLKNDPNRVRHPAGLRSGEFSSDQFHLMRSLPGEGLAANNEQATNWQALIPEFGEEVAHAFRDAAVAHWRAYKPVLNSEGASGASTPYALLFGMTGLSIESREEPTFPRYLTIEEASHALRYVTWELNGFPSWFEAVYRAFPNIGFEAVRTELMWELEHSSFDQPMHRLLHDIVYHAPWLHEEIAPLLLKWMETNTLSNPDALRYCVIILTGGGIKAAQLTELAKSKIEARSNDTQRSRWFSLWVDTNPDNAIPALATELESIEADKASEFAQRFIVSLLGDRHGAPSRFRAFNTARHLKTLYVLMHRHIRASEDIDRVGKGTYSPTLRDNAQEARNNLFNMLMALPGSESYIAIKELEKEHPQESHRKWMAIRARERAIADADEPLWTPEQVKDFIWDIDS